MPAGSLVLIGGTGVMIDLLVDVKFDFIVEAEKTSTLVSDEFYGF